MDKLLHSPLLWMTLTLAAYQAGFWLHRRLGEPLLMPPLLWSLIILITVVVVGKVDYQTYFQANSFIHFLLGTQQSHWLCLCINPCHA